MNGRRFDGKGRLLKPVRLLPEPEPRGKARGSELAVNRQVDGVVARFFKTQALEVHDQVAGEERGSFRESGNREIDLDGHAFLVQRRAVGINDAQAQFVRAFVFRSEADAQGNGADGMHDWELAGNQGVKTALDAELALVVGGEVTKSRN